MVPLILTTGSPQLSRLTVYTSLPPPEAVTTISALCTLPSASGFIGPPTAFDRNVPPEISVSLIHSFSPSGNLRLGSHAFRQHHHTQLSVHIPAEIAHPAIAQVYLSRKADRIGLRHNDHASRHRIA